MAEDITRSAFLGSLVVVCTEDLNVGDVCPICRETFSNHGTNAVPLDRPIRLHGQHIIGEHCIRTWLSEHNTCPCCRQVLFQAEWLSDEPGVEDDTPTSLTQRLPRGLTSDNSLLRELGHPLAQFYDMAVRDEDHEMTQYFSRSITARLYDRATLFQANQRSPSAEIQYQPWRGTVVPSVTGHDAPARVDSHRAAVNLWGWWWAIFTTSNRRLLRCAIHHPAATLALFETLRAIHQWHAWTMSAASVQTALRIRLRHFWRRCAHAYSPANLPRGWDDYEDDLRCAAAHAVVNSRLGASWGATLQYDDHDWSWVLKDI